MSSKAFPLDLQATSYAYIERANRALVDLTVSHVLRHRPTASILDIGCGCGANALAIKERFPMCHYTGVEPNPEAADLAEERCDEVYEGTFQELVEEEQLTPFDCVLLSDVLEHIADPVDFLRGLVDSEAARRAILVVSVPNMAVWYSRIHGLLGSFSYSFSGLYDRTHLRFFTRDSLHELFAYCGLEVLETRVTPSIVQSAAPLLRRLFDDELARGDHLALDDSLAYRVYQRWVEPVEGKVCGLWPELLGFQLVTVVRRG